MDVSRRSFLSRSLQTAGAVGLLSHTGFRSSAKAVQKTDPYRGALAVLQTLTTKSTTEIVILTEAQKFYGYQINESTGKILPHKITRRETRTHSAWGIEKLFITGLSLNVRYSLKIIDPSTGKVIDERFFSALDTDKLDPKIAVASCMKDTMSTLREVMWDNVSTTQPDMLFLIGDTCYADNNNDGSDADYWRRYVETRSLLSHFRQKNLIPTLATWDDHDFGGNNFDSTWSKKDMTKQLFEIFWRNEVPASCLEKGPGVAQVFTAFGQRFFMMDDRTFRSPRTEKNSPVQWGTKQEDFLFEKIDDNKLPVMLMNGSQFFGGYLKKDAFEYWQKENLMEVCRKLSKVEAPIIFLGGDVHFSEYMNIEPEILGYPTIEITSSSIHSTTIPFNHLRKKNKRRIDATSSYNFILMDSDANNPMDWKLRAQCISKDLKVEMDNSFAIRR